MKLRCRLCATPFDPPSTPDDGGHPSGPGSSAVCPRCGAEVRWQFGPRRNAPRSLAEEPGPVAPAPNPRSGVVIAAPDPILREFLLDLLAMAFPVEVTEVSTPEAFAPLWRRLRTGVWYEDGATWHWVRHQGRHLEPLSAPHSVPVGHPEARASDAGTGDAPAPPPGLVVFRAPPAGEAEPPLPIFSRETVVLGPESSLDSWATALAGMFGLPHPFPKRQRPRRKKRLVENIGRPSADPGSIEHIEHIEQAEGLYPPDGPSVHPGSLPGSTDAVPRIGTPELRNPASPPSDPDSAPADAPKG